MSPRLLGLMLLVLPVFVARPGAAMYDFSAVDRLLEDSLEVLAGPGGGLSLLLQQNGELIYRRSLTLPGKRFDEDSFIPIASASKWLSGAVIMALVDEGKLRLDARAGDYFPALAGEHADITLGQLFSHTSGLPGNVGGPSDCVEDSGADISLAECVEEVLAEELIGRPGRFFSYGSNSMHVAGRIAELASGWDYGSGQVWDSLFQRLLARPLGMERSRYEGPLRPTDNPRIDGGVWSTGAEYMNFLQMLLNGGRFDGQRILSEQSIAAMLSDQTGDATIVYSPYFGFGYLDPALPQTRYGVGVWRERLDAEDGALQEAASQGRFGFSPWIDLQRNLAGVLSVFNDYQKIYPTYFRLKQLIREAVPSSVTAVTDFERLDYGLAAAPNPARSVLNIHYRLPEPQTVRLRLVSMTGTSTLGLQTAEQQAGDHVATFATHSLPAGVYVCYLLTEETTKSLPVLITD